MGEYETTRKTVGNRNSDDVQFLIAKLAGEPKLEHTEQFYMKCFDDLACDRPIIAMVGYGLLPRTTIRDYGAELGFVGSDLQYFYEGVRFVELQMRKLQQHDEKKTPHK